MGRISLFTTDLVDHEGNRLIAYGTTPPTGADGYARGCVWIDIDDNERYINAGTATDAQWIDISSRFKVYADATARDAALPSPADGMVCYNESLGSEQFYTGEYWRTPSRDIPRDLQAHPAIWIPESADDIDAVDWYVYFRSRSQPSIGYCMVLQHTEDVVCIDHCRVGTVRRAWHLGYPADTEGGGITTGTTSDLNYYNMNDGTDYVDYTVPDTVTDGYSATHCRVKVYTVSGNAGEAVLIKNPGVDDMEIGSFDSDQATEAFATLDIELSAALETGDTVRLQWKSGETDAVRPHEIILFDGDSDDIYPPHEYILQNERVFSTVSAVHEMALYIAPTAAGAGQWIGGSHQTSASKETGITETWKIDGSTWVPAAGYHVARCGGNITLERSSDHTYTDPAYEGGTPTDIGDVETNYTFHATDIEVEWKYTAGVEQNLSVYYAAMAVAPLEVEEGWSNALAKQTLPSGNDSNVRVTSATQRDAAHAIILGTMTEGDNVMLELLEQSHRLLDAFVDPRTTDKKAYFSCPSINPLAATSEAFAKWRLSFS